MLCETIPTTCCTILMYCFQAQPYVNPSHNLLFKPYVLLLILVLRESSQSIPQLLHTALHDLRYYVLLPSYQGPNVTTCLTRNLSSSRDLCTTLPQSIGAHETTRFMWVHFREHLSPKTNTSLFLTSFIFTHIHSEKLLEGCPSWNKSRTSTLNLGILSQ